MSKIFNRYEHYKTPFGEMIFDRQTHSLLNKETHEVNSNEIKTSPNDVLFAIFPNQILSHIHLPSWLITVSIISSFILFIVLAVLFPKWIYPFQKKDFWPVIFIELPILIVSIFGQLHCRLEWRKYSFLGRYRHLELFVRQWLGLHC